MNEDSHYHCDVLRAREYLHRFTALLFSDPTASQWESLFLLRHDQVLRAAAGWLRGQPTAQPNAMRAGELSAEYLDPDLPLQLLPHSWEQLSVEHGRVFGLVAAGTCPPYATEYVPAKWAFRRSQMLADIAGYYRAFGLRCSPTRRERPDHLVCLFQFLAWLAELERRAWQHDDDSWQERRLICAKAQRQFFRDFVAFWTPLFAALVVQQDPQGFYGAAARWLAAWIPTERALLDVADTPLVPELSLVEPPDACAGCLASSPESTDG